MPDSLLATRIPLVPKLFTMPRSIILSHVEIDPVNRTTVTIVKPPFVAMLKLRDPASRYCDLLRSKLTWPLPFGPPIGSYVGMMPDPTPAFSRVEMDANEGLYVRAMNLAVLVNPGMHVHVVLAGTAD